MRRTLSIILLLTQLAFLSGMGKVPLLFSNKNCSLCGREVHEDMAANLTFKDGESATACCLECAMRYEAQTGKRAKDISVTDFYSAKVIDSKNAFFVTGSNLSPCCKKDIMRAPEGQALYLKYDRCLPSIIAFEKKEDAMKYMTEHGGTSKTLSEIRESK